MIHSVRGKNRALLVAAAYLMRKYEWDAVFSIEVVSACRRTRMRPAFEQVCNY
jgi:protein-tyrosine phosphatase